MSRSSETATIWNVFFVVLLLFGCMIAVGIRLDRLDHRIERLERSTTTTTTVAP